MANIEAAVAVTSEDLTEWYNIQAELTRLKGLEAMMRRRIFDYYFPAPVEGSKENKVPLNDGTGAILQADYVINRKVDEGELEKLKEAIKAEGSNLPKLPLTKLIKWTPELAKSEYNKLTDEERVAFDRCLVVKPGMPSLKIVIPKRT